MNNILVEASTIYGLFIANTILDSKLIHYDNAYLIISDNTKSPEVNQSLINTINKYDILTKNFKEIVYLNDIIYPLHPSQLNLREENINSIQRIKKMIGCEYFKTLLLESIQVSPSKYIAEIYFESDICIYSDGVMVYAPTRFDLENSILNRISKVFFIELVHNIKPLLLIEANPVYISISSKKIKEYFAKLYNIISSDKKKIIVVGQYLADLDLISADDEGELYSKILEKEISIYGNNYDFVFRPHPSSQISYKYKIKQLADKNNVNIYIDEDTLPLECRYSNINTYKVSGIFSTSLFMMKKIYNINIQSYYNDILYQKITNISNSNIIPIVLSNILFDINSKSEIFNSDDIYAVLILHAIASHKNRFNINLYDMKSIFTFSIFKKFNDIRKVYKKYAFIERPFKIINQIKNDKMTTSDLRKIAEEYIEKKQYSFAKEYLAKALASVPNNKNCTRRFIAVSSPRCIRWLLLKFSHKYK